MFWEHSSFCILSISVRFVWGDSICRDASPKVSLVLQVLCFQLFIFMVVQTYPFYNPDQRSDSEDLHTRKCLENTGVFIVSQFQYAIYGVLLCQGPPFRRWVQAAGLILATPSFFNRRHGIFSSSSKCNFLQCLANSFTPAHKNNVHEFEFSWEITYLFLSLVYTVHGQIKVAIMIFVSKKLSMPMEPLTKD